MAYPDPVLVRDYESLCAAVADLLNRQDLAAVIPNFVVLATARISRDMARIRHPNAIARSTLTMTSETAPLPADYNSHYKVRVTSNSAQIPPLEYLSPDDFDALDPQLTTIRYYTVIGPLLALATAPTAAAPATVDLWYYRTLLDLTQANNRNWVLDRHPDIYLYGAALHSAPYLKADERIQTWEAIYRSILSDIEIEASRAWRPEINLKARGRNFG